ncbi:ubiquinone biosynthesis protein [Mycobacterium vulneris]|nr:ubiquinone biosynthesis protein [Mycolicibacterium vulneris]OCB67390.1 ubiquinone biosynthesis protein [Mycolicibacterium vulneris]
MVNVSRVWQSPVFVRTVGASYDWAMGQEAAASRFGRLVMGADVERVYRAMDVVGDMPDGAAILDVPSGGGIAMLRLRPDQHVTYVGLDVSAPMLDRARRRIPAEHRDRITLVEGSIEKMPFDDGQFDLCVCFNGLHCVPDPAAAVAEIGRCLRPGGRLIGEFAVRGQLRRADVYMAGLRAVGAFGPAGTCTDAQRWFTDAGLVTDVLECTGAICHFDTHRLL